MCVKSTTRATLAVLPTKSQKLHAFPIKTQYPQLHFKTESNVPKMHEVNSMNFKIWGVLHLELQCEAFLHAAKCSATQA